MAEFDGTYYGPYVVVIGHKKNHTKKKLTCSQPAEPVAFGENVESMQSTEHICHFHTH